MTGLENLPSPVKDRAPRGSGGELSASAPFPLLPSIPTLTLRHCGCLHTGKRKYEPTPLTAITTPVVSNLLESSQLPVATLFPLGAAERERAFKERLPAAIAELVSVHTASLCQSMQGMPVDRASMPGAGMSGSERCGVPSSSENARRREMHAASVLIRFFDTVLCAYVHFDTIEASVMIATQV